MQNFTIFYFKYLYGIECILTVTLCVACEMYLRNEKLGDAFWQPSLLTWQYHLQHVAMELFHDNKDTLWCLKHALEVDNARMVEVLQKTDMTSIFNNNIDCQYCNIDV